MYLELVKQVSQVEQETEASVRQAAQQAQQMQEEAERSGLRQRAGAKMPQAVDTILRRVVQE